MNKAKLTSTLPLFLPFDVATSLYGMLCLWAFASTFYPTQCSWSLSSVPSIWLLVPYRHESHHPLISQTLENLREKHGVDLVLRRKTWWLALDSVSDMIIIMITSRYPTLIVARRRRITWMVGCMRFRRDSFLKEQHSRQNAISTTGLISQWRECQESTCWFYFCSTSKAAANVVLAPSANTTER